MFQCFLYLAGQLFSTVWVEGSFNMSLWKLPRLWDELYTSKALYFSLGCACSHEATNITEDARAGLSCHTGQSSDYKFCTNPGVSCPFCRYPCCCNNPNCEKKYPDRFFKRCAWHEFVEGRCNIKIRKYINWLRSNPLTTGAPTMHEIELNNAKYPFRTELQISWQPGAWQVGL